MNKSKVSAPKLVRVLLIVSAVFLISLFHYQTGPEAGMRHVIFRELYILPIILGAFWFGMRGGLATALLISIFYGPLVLMGPDRLTPHDLGNIMEIFLFILIGGLLGWLKDREALQQARLREAENLAAMGRATAMIAHDLKTPLITIAGLARRLSGKIPLASAEGEKIMVIRQQADRLEKMVLDMLDFAKPLTILRKSCNINQILKQANEAVHETAIKCNIKVDIQKTEKGVCKLDEGKILRVLVNLLTNAIEASPNGETVTVSLQNDNSILIVDVSDRGAGIDENIADKIFEPFISAKSKGTGLGLPISKKIVAAHSGRLEYRNNSGTGTTFRISIPIDF